jgi:hypothetical protein
MLEVLMIIVLIGVILFGFVVMRSLDLALNHMNEIQNTVLDSEKAVLVLSSDHDADEWIQVLSTNKISFQKIHDPDLSDLKRFSVVLALSDKDLDNLLLCNKAKHANEKIFTVARCNNYIYKSIFIQQGIDRIVTEHLAADAITRILQLG